MFYVQTLQLAQAVKDAASFKATITLTKGVCWNASALANMTQILGFGFFGDSQNITDWALQLKVWSWSHHRQYSAKYMAVPLSYLLHLQKHTTPHVFSFTRC